MNITVADFKNGKQEDAYMLGSRGYNNIAVSSSIVEKMASDPAATAKYEKVFAEMSGNSERIEKFARENNDEILSAGALIDKNGKVSYWMVGRSRDTMENPGTVYKEKVQKQIAEKRAKKKEEEALKEKKLAKAESVEKLMEQVKKGFYKYGGMSGDNTAETDAYYDKIHSYVKSLDLSTRRAAPWTLSQLHLEISGRVTQAVKEKDPTWTAGKPISHEILDEIFAGDTIYQDSVNALYSKDSKGLDIQI